MKIAIDVVPIRTGGRVGGAMPFTLELIKGMAQSKSLEIVLLTASWNDEYFKELFAKFGVKNHLVISEEIVKKDIKYWQRIISIVHKIRRRIFKRKLLHELGAELLFCPMSAVSFHESGIPTVSTILDIQHEYYPQFFESKELAHRKAFYKKICAQAKAIVCISKYTRETFVEKFGFPEERVYVVHIGIQERLALPNHNQQEKFLKQKSLQGVTYAYYPANFWPHKNHNMLLTAFSMFSKKHSNMNLHLVLTGNALDRDKEIRDALNQMDISDRVHILGYLPEEEIAIILSQAKFLIFPSLFEGFGIPAVEAMMFGKPVLCSNRTSLPEIVGDAGLYFDPRMPDQIEEAIFRVMDDKNLEMKLIHLGSERVKQFSLQSMVDQYITIFNQVSKKH